MLWRRFLLTRKSGGSAAVPEFPLVKLNRHGPTRKRLLSKHRAVRSMVVACCHHYLLWGPTLFTKRCRRLHIVPRLGIYDTRSAATPPAV